jgi:hypothetical protein
LFLFAGLGTVRCHWEDSLSIDSYLEGADRKMDCAKRAKKPGADSRMAASTVD